MTRSKSADSKDNFYKVRLDDETETGEGGLWGWLQDWTDVNWARSSRGVVTATDSRNSKVSAKPETISGRDKVPERGSRPGEVL